MRVNRWLPAGLAVLVAALAPGAGATRDDRFVEPVKVLYTLEGEIAGANFGWAVSELEDVDRDRRMDLIVGAPFSSTGTTFVYSGRSGELLFRLDGAAGDQQGYAIADAGDTSGDHVADVVSGAPGVGPGHVYLYSGRTGRLLHTFAGLGAGDFFGSAVASAGDVDRDGRADILVGAELADARGVDSGRAYVFSGRTFELLLTLEAGDAGDNFGSATDWTEDLNRDRIPDLIVGARNAGPEARGRAYVFSGKTGKLLFEIEAPASGGDLGYFFVAGVGDVNGDSRPDVYAADFSDGSLGPATGRAAVYSGKNGRELLSWTGSAAGEGLGPGREAGDVNRDGHVDLAIGSWISNDGAPTAGQVEIYSGKDGSLLRRITSTTAGENFGFDTVGLGDLNRDRIPDLVASAATGETVYVIAGRKR
jgi:FG-GAP repeat/FG-GAP-like repeat